MADEEASPGARPRVDLDIERTGKGLPALWECGGGYTNTGYAQVIAGEYGEMLTPVYIPKGGPLANGNHALFVVREGTVVVTVIQKHGDASVQVWRIKGIINDKFTTELITEYRLGEWTTDHVKWHPGIKAAVQAAVDKASCYHCREPHYALPMPEQKVI